MDQPESQQSNEPRQCSESSNWPPPELRVTSLYAKHVLEKVDAIVAKELYSETLAKECWPAAVQKHRKAILRSKNLCDLTKSINEAVRELKSSHCEFCTVNDEIFYFLHSLFSQYSPELRIPPMDFTGVVTGGPGCRFDQVRYVLDESPGAKGNIQVGDRIVSVNGKPYIGQANFFHTANHSVALEIERASEKIKVHLTPVKKQDFRGYLEATRASARVIQSPAGELGYVHVWCGGTKRVLEELLAEKLRHTNGLILDLRDGYGGNALTDLDQFYRNAVAFPDLISKGRSGKIQADREYYDKPVVLLINRGSRSGKELLAHSLKTTHRAVLVGETTAGAVLAGRLFPIDKRTALYLAVTDITVGKVRLEGRGVDPDREVKQASCSEAEKERQFQQAKNELLKLLEENGSTRE